MANTIESRRMSKRGDKPAETIYKRLNSDLGITKSFLKNFILPDWWDDEILKSPSGFQEFQLYLLGNMGISLESWKGSKKLKFSQGSKVLFKKTAKQDITKFTTGIHLAKSIAEKAIFSIGQNQRIPKDAQEVRETFKNKQIHLKLVLEYFANSNIPIIPIYGLPKQTSLPAAMVFRIDGKYAIAVGSRKRSPAQQAFHLLHELGHIARGHISEKVGSYIDFSIEKDQEDELETEANKFAVEVFTGFSNFETHLFKAKDPKEFATECKTESKKVKVSPAFLALNFAWANPKDQLWPFVNKVLEHLEPKDALEQISNHFFQFFSKENVSEEYFEFLSKIAQV